MSGELPTLTKERSVIISEVRLALGRMREDLHKPPHVPLTSNRVHSLISRQIQEGIPEDEEEAFSQGGILVDISLLEMIFAYRYKSREKPDSIPDSPEEFFGTLENISDWGLQQERVGRREILRARTIFRDATNVLCGEVPLLWVFAQATDVIMQGLNIKSVDKFDTVTRSTITSGPIPRLPPKLQRMIILDEFLLTGLHAYVHPETVTRLVRLGQEEYVRLIQNGVDLPIPPTAEEIPRYQSYLRELVGSASLLEIEREGRK